MSYDVSLLLDGLILVFLCVTIFYAARLSLFMKSFREGRSDMQRLIRDLSITIDKAEASVALMKENASNTEVEIRNIINEAKFLSDELRFMNETGDNLADRLEKLADRNRELVDLMERSGGIGTQKIMPYEPSGAVSPRKEGKLKNLVESQFEIDDFDLEENMDEDDEFDFMALEDGAYREDGAEDTHESRVNTEAKSKVRSFAIFDREFDADLETEETLNDVKESVFESTDGKKFHSRAEQDLYEALQRKKRDYDKTNRTPQDNAKSVSKIS